MPTPDQGALDKLNALIKDIRTCMMTTWDAEVEGLRARPMATQNKPTDGKLWFFTDKRSHKLDELSENPHVGLSYAGEDGETYISITGRASTSDSRAKMEEYWNPWLKVWWPDGLEDPNITLLCVEADAAEYWDEPAGKLVQLFGFAKAFATGTQYKGEGMENEKLDL